MKLDEPEVQSTAEVPALGHILKEGLEQPVCTICRQNDIADFPAGAFHLNLLPPLAVARCRRCDTLFPSPRPNQDMRKCLMDGRVPELLRGYSATPANYSGKTKGRYEFFQDRLAFLASLINVTGSGPLSLLDVGASSGVLVEQARSLGWNAHGVEPSAKGTASALKSGIQLPRGLAEALPFASNTFEVVHCHHVFEHLADPLVAAHEIYRVLRPGGLVFIEVPNQLANVMFRRDLVLRRVSQRKRDIRSIHHLWFFSRRTLRALLVRADFKDVRVKDQYMWKPHGLTAPLTLLTRLAGILFYGGPLVQAVGRKPQ